MIEVGPRLTWLALGTSHKTNSAKYSVQLLAVLTI